jgi:hypothetical protein
VKFDWYQGTVDASPQVLINLLQDASSDGHVEPGPVFHGYTHGYDLKVGEVVQARVMYGGQSQGPGVHVISSGANAAWLAGTVRGAKLRHRVSRCDVAHDREYPGAWKDHYDIGIAVAEEFNLKTMLQGDYHREKDGRTLYLGAKTSRVRCRIYEKGVESDLDRPDLVRVEVQCRPKGESGYLVAQAEPVAIFRCTKWSEMIAACMQVDSQADAVKVGTLYEPSDDERAFAWLVKQYGGLLQRVSAQVGGPAMLGWLLHAAMDTSPPSPVPSAKQQ